MDQFRHATITDLLPVGAVERELADRVAGLMWRLRRVARHEAAALSVPSALLPPRPDEIGAREVFAPGRPVPSNATVVDRLADLRYAQESSSCWQSLNRAAAAAVGPGNAPRKPLDAIAVEEVLGASLVLLDRISGPDPWPAALAAAGSKRNEVHRVRWTRGRLFRVLRVAAGLAGLDLKTVVTGIRAELAERIANAERRADERKQEELKLIAEVNEERATSIAAQLYVDEALIQRVARAESHLARELDRTLGMLAKLQGQRCIEFGAGAHPCPVGFVLQDAPPEGHTTEDLTPGSAISVPAVCRPR
ncbi:hypothetical protein J8F10_16420 [Gemmata sp. G18]|uniref:Uncharacterized protein n=1 Tax=Gemmata palustris TaxID=2822762 RepID=A0ABS5BT26_9BACT|nr:hypothetical protein [Gemmata palustris]MBP3956858.1 hypothetical protein [Gemmata palustris]